MSDNTKEVIKSIVTIIPSIIAVIAVYWNTWGEKNKKRYEKIQSKREDCFEPFIQQCTVLIDDPGKIFDKKYISDLNISKAKVLLYADNSLFDTIIKFVNKYQNIFNAYMKAYKENDWDFWTRYEDYLEYDFPDGEDVEEFKAKLENDIDKEIEKYKNEHKIDTQEVNKEIEGICKEMRKNLESIK